MNYKLRTISNEPRTINNELRSINIERLCETNPISEKPKMNLNFYSAKNYDNKSGLLMTAKQTQFIPTEGGSNPTCSELACTELVECVEPISKRRKITCSKIICRYNDWLRIDLRVF